MQAISVNAKGSFLPSSRRKAFSSHIRPVRASGEGKEPQNDLPQKIAATAWMVVAAVLFPVEAEAKQTEPPPPPPTAFDELSKIVSGRSGSTSLFDSFKKTVTAPVEGVLQSAPKLPEAPQVTEPKKAEPASTPKAAPSLFSKPATETPAKSVPAQAEAAVQEVQNSADQAVDAAPGNPVVAIVGILAAALGFGGYKAVSGKQGQVASNPKAAGRQVARQAQSKVRGAKQPVKRAAQAFRAPKQAVKKAAPKVTRNVQRAASNVRTGTKRVGGLGTQRVGTQRAGTKRVGTQRAGTQRAGTRRVGGTQPSSRRVKLDEDTSSTLGAAGVVGLGVAVSAFILAQVVSSDDSATAQEAVQAVKEVPAKIAEVAKAPEQVAKKVEQAPPAPEVKKAPNVLADAAQAVKEAAPSAPEVKKAPNVVADAAQAVKEAAPSAPEVKKAPNVLADAAQAVKEAAPSPPEVKKAPDVVADAAQAVKEAAPSAPEVKEVKKAPNAVADAAESAKDALPSVPEEVKEAPKAAAEAVQKAAPSISTTAEKAKAASSAAIPADAGSELQQTNPAFEEARKKLNKGIESGASQFAKVSKEEEQKAAGKPAAQGKQLGSGGKVEAGKAAEAAAPSSGLILAGLAVVAVIGVAAASQQNADGGASGGESGSKSGGDVSGDIAARKQEARKWIDEWRKETGGK